ncbi:hypothetical protein SAMN02745206_03078 [Desulfacinum infernum DSM 9756]|uniref:Uncharacterized protein n=1 Tax=Desulfacinum infernum DSM 9756 TaxID=1121391 RepID=A0A1M5G820_9BACT|nr:hypothetical protein [Desulfacinum infernum]SHF99866.1 hypothetical protein SAMN02745206_03078 [Desulfacinum infernum DSM 9756]
MKRTDFLIILLALGLTVIPAASASGDPSRDAYYRNCVDKRIENCERKAAYSGCSGDHMRECAENAGKEAAFLKANKEKLTREMKADGVEPVEYKVNYRLIRAYTGNSQ